MTEEFQFSEELQKSFAKAFKAEQEKKLEELAEAATHFEAARYGKAQKILNSLLVRVSNSPELYELAGLCQYRQENFKEAIEHLENFGKKSDSIEQYPVLADCYRAIGDYKKVKNLWKTLEDSQQNEELKIEGRIVYAGSLSDSGNPKEAVRILLASVGEQKNFPDKPKLSQIRQVYALADIYDQSGSFIKAKHLFQWIVEKDTTELTDATQRLSLMD